MKKESLSASMPKLITAVSLIVGIGALLGAAGYLAKNKITKNEILLISTKSGKVSLINPEEVDIFKFIPSNSLLMQKVMDDIDMDGKKEIVLFYLVDPKDFVFPSKDGDLNFMILKTNAEGNYNVAWQYFYGSMSYLPNYTTDRIYVYEKETDMPKINFFIDYEATQGINFFVYYDKNASDFKVLRATNEDTGNDKISIQATKITGSVEMKDMDGDGLQEIKALTSGYIYKLDKDNRVYKVINSCLSTKTILKVDDPATRIYSDDRYHYQIEFPAKSSIVCNNSTVQLGGIRISMPEKGIDISKINEYKCKTGEETIIGSTSSGTRSITCKNFYSNSGLEIFKKITFWPHDGSFSATYSVIKEENSNKFTIVQITTASQGTGEGKYNDRVETFKFTK